MLPLGMPQLLLLLLLLRGLKQGHQGHQALARPGSLLWKRRPHLPGACLMSFLEGSAHCLQFLHQHHLSSSSQQLPAAMSLGCQQQ